MTKRTRADLEAALGRAQAALVRLHENHFHVDLDGEEPEESCITCAIVADGLGE
jgi:hypothetical protein